MYTVLLVANFNESQQQIFLGGDGTLNVASNRNRSDVKYLFSFKLERGLVTSRLLISSDVWRV